MTPRARLASHVVHDMTKRGWGNGLFGLFVVVALVSDLVAFVKRKRSKKS